LFIVPGGISCSFKGLTILAPEDASVIAYGPVGFSWEKNTDSTVYLVSFFDQPDGKPIFSAYTKGTSYTLPGPVVEKGFKAGRKYFWRVTGFDKQNHTICENRRYVFSFR
jgi:hypothetical protein